MASIPLRITLTTILRAVVQPAGVDLADGRRRERGRVELGEQLLGRLAQFVGDGLADDLGRVGRGVGLELGQLVGEGRADDVRAGAEHLAELDERGAQVGQGEADAGLVGDVGDPLEPGRREVAAEPVEVAEPAHPVGQPVLGQDGDDLGQPAGVLLGAGQAVEEHIVSVAGGRGGRYAGRPEPRERPDGDRPTPSGRSRDAARRRRRAQYREQSRRGGSREGDAAATATVPLRIEPTPSP